VLVGYLLYLLISGDVLYVGLCLLASGAVMGVWQPGVGIALAWLGLVLAIASAVPIHPAAYVLLGLTVLAWQVCVRRKPERSGVAGVAVCLVVAVVLGAGLADRFPPRVSLPRETAVFVVGDSLSAGLSAPGRGSWPQLLAATLDLHVSNLARAGATLSDGVAQVQAIPPGAAIVLVELGGNDVLARGTPQRFGSDLDFLLNAAVGDGRKILMFELPLMPLQNTLGRVQREVCRKHGVTLLPRSLLAGAVALPNHTTDGLHLSARGHAWLAEHVASFWLEDDTR
jgi:lysophospholipase L1-like esterase